MIVPKLTPVQTRKLDRLLLKNGELRHLPYRVLEQCDQLELAVWCHSKALYSLPTVELIEWLRTQLKGLTAIEIGAGRGGIGKALGIPTTDSLCQNRLDLKAYYSSIGAPTIQYPDYVEHLDAQQAIAKYQPDCVIGSWITQLYDKCTEQGFIYGVNEHALLKSVKKYILIGHEGAHNLKTKSALELPHKEYKFPFIKSRAISKGDNIAMVWECPYNLN